MFDTQLGIVLDGGAFGIPEARFLVYLLEILIMSWRRSQLTTTVSPAR